MIERKIYSSWAFTENEREKAMINREIYQELLEKHKVLVKFHASPTEEELASYEIILMRKSCYKHSETTVIKNEPKLSNTELALITDSGNLCFGYAMGNIEHNLRIRKLTPKECWRLMGFSDDDFEKASKVNSNSQLYKQAGNSIVVTVLEAIFKNLF